MPKATPSILLSSGQAGPLRPSESCEHSSLWTSSMLLAASAAILRSPAFPQPPRHFQALPAYLCAQGCPTELDGHGCEGSDFPFEITRDQFYQLNESAVPDGIHPRALKELAGVTAGSPPQSTHGPGCLGRFLLAGSSPALSQFTRRACTFRETTALLV